MNVDRIQDTLEAYRAGSLPLQQAVEILKQMSYEPLGQFANLDHHRSLRTGFPEVIFSPGKTPAQIVEIFKRLADKNDRVLATVCSRKSMRKLAASCRMRSITRMPGRSFWTASRTGKKSLGWWLSLPERPTSLSPRKRSHSRPDGNAVQRVFDVGVSGLHRLLDHLPVLQAARVIVVAAGMEGALPSVVGGLVPVW